MLVVCTANICRSPAGAALLRSHLAARGVRATVKSAGVAAGHGGRPVDPVVAAVLAERGIVVAGHESQPLVPALVTGADLVVTMERRHLREAAVLARGSWQHVYTLKELLRRAGGIGRRGDAPLGTWLAAVHGDRTSRELLADDPFDEVDDPTGGPEEGYRRLVAELDGLTAELAALVF